MDLDTDFDMDLDFDTDSGLASRQDEAFPCS